MKNILVVYSVNDIDTATAHQLGNSMVQAGYRPIIIHTFNNSGPDIRLWDLDQLEPGEFGVIKEMMAKVIKGA